MSAFPLPTPSPAFGPSLVKVRAPASAAGAEMQGFSARLLADLPLSPSFGLHVAGIEGVVRVELAPDVVREPGDVVFSRAEWIALCRGIEADRIWPADFATICARKAANPAHRLELEEALAGAQVDKSECWTLARLLERVDAHLMSV